MSVAFDKIQQANAEHAQRIERLTLFGQKIEVRQPDLVEFRKAQRAIVKDETNPDEVEAANDPDNQLYQMILLTTFAEGENEPLFPNVEEIQKLKITGEVLELINAVTKVVSMDSLVQDATKNLDGTNSAS